MGVLVAVLLTTLITWHLSLISTYCLLRWLLRGLAEEAMPTPLRPIAEQMTTIAADTRQRMHAAKETLFDDRLL
jgi:hypothetical protein